jgi:hypothetical protein
MKRFGMSIAMAWVLVALLAGPTLAFHCPAMIKECQATADSVAGRQGSDKAMVEQARKGCDAAMKLHQEGKHKESMIEAGAAIVAASKALN